ncbi:hypothetical protein [Streptomyces sp. NBC_00847]|uniref:hypothetical protein n=1 Tax=Streptomyces sp. NBC_00847 TaxID=2975850 RepID=UPI00225E1BCD|nr:hypothetical protein [Streptomyces sp. NBC_00847]MCX4886081.1 hypothetical protein [Streptomyces sp. NBC_00847]
MKNKTRLKAEALETAIGMVPLIGSMILAIVTVDATEPLGMGASFLLAFGASMSVCCVGFVAMRAAYTPVVIALRAAADQETEAGR